MNNPYGGGPNTGITLPPYYRPTPSVKNANNDKLYEEVNALAISVKKVASGKKKECGDHHA